jgi:hypothetical protein
VLVGRDEQLARLVRGLSTVSTALLYGVAGVGKSAIAYAWAARWAHGTVYRRAHAEPLQVLVDDLRRQLAEEPVPEMTSDEERLADLVDRVEAAESALIVDDLHQLAAGDRATLVEAIAAGVRRGRLIATSRERIPISAGGADRLEVRIDGLDEPAARDLWNRLDELYGPADGFERANRGARGNPFQLRRRHAGGLDDDDPIAAAVRRLAEDERHIAGALALANWRLPLATLEALMTPERARAALRRLTTLLIAEVDGADTAGIHNLFQEAVRAELGEEEKRRLHRELARAVPDAGFDLAIEVREMTRHHVAAGQLADLGRYLEQRAVEMIRDGETSELLNAIDAIAPVERSPSVRLTRARCLARLLRYNESSDELTALVQGGEPTDEIRLSMADAAIIAGRIPESVSMLRALCDSARIAPALRQQALTSYAVALTHAGQGDRAREVLTGAGAVEQDSRARALLAFWAVCTLWMEERDDEGEEHLRRARGLLPDPTVPYAAGSLVPLTLASVQARLGRFDEVDELRRLAASTTARDNDPYTRAYEVRVNASIAFERGERAAALEMLETVATQYQRGGCTLPGLWARAWVGRILLVMGRRARGIEVLDAVEREAVACGARSILVAVANGRQLDPLVEVDSVAVPVSQAKRGRATRARLLEALRSAASGGGARALDLARAAEAAAVGPGYALDRALAKLVDSTVARLEGRTGEAGAELSRATALAAEEGVDPDLLPSLNERLGALRLVTGNARRTASLPDLALERYPVVLDGRTHELCVDDRRIALGRRPILRKLLYAMASRPNQVLTKEALAARIWPSRYSPSRHDNALWVNVRRLRVLLEPSGLRIELTEDGYRLITPEGFVYVDPGST